MKALFFSDLHLHFWEHHNVDNSRLRSQLRVFEKMVRLSSKHSCPVFFGGDLFNTPKEIANKLLGYVIPYLREVFTQFPEVKVYAISGNHDLCDVNSYTHRSSSYVKTLGDIFPDNIVCIDFREVEFDDFIVHGIPYIDHNINLCQYIEGFDFSVPKKHILLVHTSFKGQTDTNGVIVGTGENIDEEHFNKPFLTFAGHIHKHGIIRDKIISIGAPLQIRLSDMDGRFGFWKIKDDFSVRFSEIKNTPKFRVYSSVEERDNETDFWVKVPKENVTLKVVSLTPHSLDRVSITTQFLKDLKVVSRRRRHLVLTLVNNTL